MKFEIVLLLVLAFGICLCIKNIIYGESIIIFSSIALALNGWKEIHSVYCLLLGALGAVIFYIAISRIRILRYLMSLLISGGLALIMWYDLAYKENINFTWVVFWSVFTFILVLGMHIAGYEHIKESLEKSDEYVRNKLSDKRRVIYFVKSKKEQSCDNQHSSNNTADEYYKRYYEEHKNDNVQNNTFGKIDYYESLFEGCESLETVKKRYKELMKIYHPDVQNGSSEKTQNITEAYEKIMNERFLKSN